MSGLVKTVPYRDVINRIEENGGFVIDKAHAALDQKAGVAEAYKRGYKNIAVTVAIPAEAKKIREMYPGVMIFGVHVTGFNSEEAETRFCAFLQSEKSFFLKLQVEVRFSEFFEPDIIVSFPVEEPGCSFPITFRRDLRS